MSEAAKKYLLVNGYNDTEGWVSKDYCNPIDIDDLAELLEAYHQEQLKVERNIGDPLTAQQAKERDEILRRAHSTAQPDCQWISVEERLPDSGRCVMIFSGKSGVAEGAWFEEKAQWEQWRWRALAEDVTHWMPLPKPPTP